MSPRGSAHVLWTDERRERAKTLWKEGVSASEIAQILGGTTRNAVIGVVHRSGLVKTRVAASAPSAAKAQKPVALRQPLKAPPVARAPYQNAGLSFGTRKIAKPETERAWPDDQAAEFARLYETGAPVPRICEEMNAAFPGADFTVKALYRKAERLGLKRDAETRAMNKRAAAAKARSRKPILIAGNGVIREQAEAPPPRYEVKAGVWEPLPGVEPIPFMERRRTQCAWPIGEATGANMMCCGAFALDERYCRPHARIADTPTTVKQRVDQRLGLSTLARRVA